MELLEVAVVLHQQCVLVLVMRRRWRVYGISFPILLRVDGVFLSGAVGGIVESSGEIVGGGRRLGPGVAEVQPVGSGGWRRGWRWWLVSGVWWRVSSATELAAPL